MSIEFNVNAVVKVLFEINAIIATFATTFNLGHIAYASSQEQVLACIIVGSLMLTMACFMMYLRNKIQVK